MFCVQRRSQYNDEEIDLIVMLFSSVMVYTNHLIYIKSDFEMLFATIFEMYAECISNKFVEIKYNLFEVFGLDTRLMTKSSLQLNAQYHRLVYFIRFIQHSLSKKVQNFISKLAFSGIKHFLLSSSTDNTITKDFRISMKVRR